MTALGTFFRKHAQHEIPIGSVKPNIGHLESAAGAAAVIKVLLMMKNKKLVPSIHAKPLNPRIPFNDLKLKVCLKETSWPENTEGVRIASINCFGFGGTNAHAIVTDYKTREVSETQSILHTCLCSTKYVILSAEDLNSLYSAAKHLLISLTSEISLSDLSNTTVHFRSHYRFRKVFVVREINDLRNEIKRFDNERLPIKAIGKENPKLVFVYCGVGTTWHKMCKYLMKHDNIFRRTMVEIDSHLSSFTDISVQSMFENEDDVSDPLKNHLAIFACQIGLTEMWKYLGVCPDSIVGQSVGEVAAAYASNTLSLKDSVKVIYCRSLNLANESAGKMILIRNCNVDKVEEKCKQLVSGKANIAVYHSPVSCAVSGDTNAVTELQAQFSDQPVNILPLNVKCAYHSHLTQNASLKLEKNLTGLENKKPCIPIISTVTGKNANDNFGSANYWAKNVTEPVLFHHAIVESKQNFANAIFLEIGPTPVLKAHLPNIFPDSIVEALPSMKRNTEFETFQKTFLNLFGKGIFVKWKHVVPVTNKILDIPHYQFSKRQHLSTSENLRDALNGYKKSDNMLFLSQVPGKDDQFTMVISKETTSFVYEHVVDGNIIVPGALFGEIALQIGNMQIQNCVSSDVNASWTIHRALLITKDEHVLTIKTKHETEQAIQFEVFSSDTPSSFSSGRVTFTSPQIPCNIDISPINSILKSDGNSSIVYLALGELGFQYGPMYKTIKNIAVRNSKIFCDVFIPNCVMKEVNRTYLHPVIIDTMAQCTVGARLKNTNLSTEKVLPVRVSHMIVRQRPKQRMICYAKLVNETTTNASFDVFLFEETGKIVAEMLGFEIEKISSLDSIRSLSFYESWKEYDIHTLPRMQTTGSKHSISIFSWNQDYLSIIENAFQKTKNVTLYGELLTNDSLNNFNALMKKTSPKKMSVVFAPGVAKLTENTKGEQLLSLVSQITNTFLFLLKTFFQNNIHIIVLTNETQPCPSSKMGVIGTELWGMVRAVKHEGTALSFTLLDIDDLSEFVVDCIVQIATSIDFEGMQLPREYAVRKNVIYKNELLKMPEDFYKRAEKRSLYKTSGEDTGSKNKTSEDIYCIRRHSGPSTEILFGVPSVEDRFIHQNGNLVQVTPFEVLVCRADSFHSIRDVSLFDVSDTKFKGTEIRVCEIRGHAKIGGKDVEIIACCHTGLKTKIRIERKCVFKTSSFKNYRTGYLHATIVAQALSELVKNRTHVVIECSQGYYQICTFLRALLAKKNCIIYFQDHSSERRNQNTFATDMIILTRREYIETQSLKITYPNLKRCFSLKGTLPQAMHKENSLIQFHAVDVEGLYETSKLCIASKRASHFLISFLKRNHEFEYFGEFDVLNITEITKHLEIRTTEELLIKRDSAYIVIGGLTGLGWSIVKYLSKKKAKTIISISRRPPTSEAEQCILNIKNIHDVEIIHREVDITKLEDLKEAVQSIQQSMPDTPIRGVFQGAAVLRDSTVPKMTQDLFDIPLKAKILGTWNLHLVTRHMNLDIFMMHSSVASVFGNYCQTNYAAANAFEDSFAHYRKELGYSAQTINWGALNVGLGANPALRDIFFHKGVRLMSEEQIYNCLTQMLLSERAQGIFVDFDIKQFLATNNLKWQNSKYAGIVPENTISSSTELVENASNIGVDEDIVQLVKQVSAEVLLHDISEITETSSLAQYGVDSQNGIEIINTIYSRTNVRIPILMLLSRELTFQDLGRFIKEKLEMNNMAENGYDGGTHAEGTLSKPDFRCMQDKNAILVFSFEISKCMNDPEMWKKITQIMIRMNPSLLVNVIEDDSNSANHSETITSVEDYIISFKTTHRNAFVSQSMAKTNNKNVWVLYEDKTESAVLNIFGRRSQFDAFCGKIILRDLQIISEHVVAKQDVPAWFHKLNFNFLLMGANELRNTTSECKEYWKSRLNLCRASASLNAVSSSDLEIPEQNAKIHPPTIDVRGLMNYAFENSLTLCSLVASAYQIMLHHVTHTERIPLIMEVDLRMRNTDCRKQVSPCSNFLPIISPLFSYLLKDYLRENNDILKEGFSHNLFPYGDIIELQEFVKEVHESHFFLFTEVTDNHPYVNGGYTTMERDSKFETMLIARHGPEKNNLGIEFHFCSQRVSNYCASFLCEFILGLLQSLQKLKTKSLMYLQTRAALNEGAPVLLPPGMIKII